MPTLEEIAYAAGFFDGEGCVVIARSPTTKGTYMYTLVVQAGQNDPTPLVFLKGTWGGSFYVGHRKDSGRQYHQWSLSGWRAARFLSDVLPYLKVKREQALLAIDFQKTKGQFGNRRVQSSVIIKQGEIRDKIIRLNSGKGARYFDGPVCNCDVARP